MSDLQLLCWDCKLPLDEEDAVIVPTSMLQFSWSTSTTKVHPGCAEKREYVRVGGQPNEQG